MTDALRRYDFEAETPRKAYSIVTRHFSVQGACEPEHYDTFMRLLDKLTRDFQIATEVKKDIWDD